MKAGCAALVLIAMALLTGCGKKSASEVEASESPAANQLAVVAPTAIAAPMLKAASYPPRDDCGALPGWTKFRSRLETAVVRRDADALALLTDPAVRLDFGGGSGVEEMRRRLEDKDYKLWAEIAALLPLGCGVQDGNAAMPWIFFNAPEDADPYSGMLILGSAVPAYAKADAGSSVTATLNWAIVMVDGYQGPDKPLTKVTLPGGSTTAFVETAKLRSLVDYRLIVSQGDQGWRITALIAGD